MNNLYGTDFPEPKQMKTEGHYVPSLTGEGKMSKSVEGSYVNLTDNLETIKTKLAKVPTDSGRGNKAPEEGGVHTLMTLVELFGGEKKRKEYEKQYQRSGIKYQGLKNELAGAIYEELKPIQEERKKLEKDPEYVEKVLREGAKKARQIASQTVVEVKEKMGLLLVTKFP